jgi:hypothetical protein
MRLFKIQAFTSYTKYVRYRIFKVVGLALFELALMNMPIEA